MELSTTWEGAGSATTREPPSNFMEPKISLPHSQEISTSPYLEPDQSHPHNPILYLQDPPTQRSHSSWISHQ
jgi:hypothetical protein